VEGRNGIVVLFENQLNRGNDLCFRRLAVIYVGL
jgi:hypothetical protein